MYLHKAITTMAISFVLVSIASTGWSRWNPGESLRKAVSGEESLGEQFNKQADKERKKFQKEVKKAEKVLDDSKRAYRKAQKYAKKYRSVKIPKFPADSLKNADPSRFVSGTYDAWKGYLSALEKAGIPAGELNRMFGGEYTSNKRDKMRAVERGGWIVAWGREINERDAGDGVVAAGVSIFSGGSSAYMWAQRLVMESIEKMGRSMRDAGNRLGDQAQDRLTRVAKKVISDALRAKMPKSDSLSFGNLQAKAGLVKYSGTNSFKLPGGNRTTVSKTWGFIPYVAVRINDSRSGEREARMEADRMRREVERVNRRFDRMRRIF